MGEGVDFDDGGAPALGLALKSEPPPPAGSLAPPGTTPSNAPAGVPQNSYAPGNRLASLRAIAEPQTTVTHNQVAVAAIAGYGPAPAAVWESPLYAWRVFTRKRALRTLLSELEGQVRAAESALDERLADITRSMRHELEADNRFAQSFAGVRQLEGMAGSAGSELSEANTAYKQQAQKLVSDLGEVDKQLADRRAAEKTAEAAVAAAHEAWARVDARQKRAQIELRAAIQVSGAQPGVPVAIEHAQKIEGIQRDIAAAQPELDEKQRALAGAKGSLTAVAEEIQLLERQHRQIQDRRRQIQAHFEKQIDQRSKQLSSVERDVSRALAEVARAALAAKVEVDPNSAQVIAGAEEDLGRLREKQDLHVAALDAFDRNAVQRGYLIVGVAVGVVLLLIVLVIVL
jgi:hypothetical protein